ncbi:MAG: RHS repeat-associated core domain-containing protein [Bacteroidales bacterium]|nr:RHS repeat-associated core domain-containing protein [Bacteroidales bacterium]
MKTNVTYHTDHLGSNSFVTDYSGKAIQELRYMPYGEILTNKRSTGSNYNTPYKFSAKEKDAETGFNYFGARYYVDYMYVWLSVDPMSDKYPSTSPYMYCLGNPVKLVDPDGMEFNDPDDLAKAQASQKAARNRIITLRTEIDGLKSAKDIDKKAIKDKETQIDILNTHIFNIQEMIDNKDWKFKYKEIDGNPLTAGTYYENGVVVMEIDENADKQAHEGTNSHQHINCELRIKSGKDDMRFYDLGDEANAYQVEYSFRSAEGQAKFRRNLGVPSVKGVKDITPGKLIQSNVIKEYYPYIVSKYLQKHQ